MDAIEVIKSRRSVRKYKDEKVDRNILRDIVDIARWAPSWKNLQIARYTFVDDEKLIKEIADKGVHGFSYNIKTLQNAKGVLVLSFVKGKSGKLNEDEYATSKKDIWEVFDAGIACQTFCLAAEAKGIGTCVFGVIDDAEIAEIAKIPKGETVAAIITYGYPDESPAITPRKPAEEIMRFL